MGYETVDIGGHSTLLLITSRYEARYTSSGKISYSHFELVKRVDSTQALYDEWENKNYYTYNNELLTNKRYVSFNKLNGDSTVYDNAYAYSGSSKTVSVNPLITAEGYLIFGKPQSNKIPHRVIEKSYLSANHFTSDTAYYESTLNAHNCLTRI